MRGVSRPDPDDLAALRRSAVHADGRTWCGPTSWDGATAMRVSASSWRTGTDDAEAVADAILACADRVRGPRGPLA